MSRQRSTSLASQGSLIVATSNLSAHGDQDINSKLARKSFPYPLTVNEGVAAAATVSSLHSNSSALTSSTVSPPVKKFDSLVRRIKKKVGASISAPSNLPMQSSVESTPGRFRRAMSEDASIQEELEHSSMGYESGSTSSEDDDSDSRSDTSTLSLPVPRWRAKQLARSQQTSLRTSTADSRYGTRGESSPTNPTRVAIKTNSEHSLLPLRHSKQKAALTRSKGSASLSSGSWAVSSAMTTATKIPNTSLAYSMMFGELGVKCMYKGVHGGVRGVDISLIRIDESHLDFNRFLNQLESIHEFTKRGVEVELIYNDSEGDKIRIKDNSSLSYACKDWRKQQSQHKDNSRHRSKAGSMRIVVKEKRRED